MQKVFNAQFGSIASALGYLPDDTVIDGEIVAVDEEGRPNFNLLQNFRSAGANVMYFVFDVMMCGGEDLMRRPLSERRSILASMVRPEGQIGISESSDMPLAKMERFIRSHGLEGIVLTAQSKIEYLSMPVTFSQGSESSRVSPNLTVGSRAYCRA